VNLPVTKVFFASLNNLEYISEHPAYKVNSLALDKRPELCFHELKISKPVSVFFLTDQALLEVNQNVLGHDYYTDIISFDYSEDDDIERSEILISLDRVKENAEQMQLPFVEELHRVIIHGLLHFAGYKDDDEAAKKKMRSMEDHFLDLQRST